MSQIAGDVASSMGLSFKFQATDRNVANYAYTGSAAGQVDKLNKLGGMDAYIDDGMLVCKNRGMPLADAVHTLSSESGMIGQVEVTEWGVRVRCLLSPNVQLGGTLNLTSTQNPSLNGSYTIYKTGFQIATRDAPFYDVIEATRYPAIFYTASMPV